MQHWKVEHPLKVISKEGVSQCDFTLFVFVFLVVSVTEGIVLDYDTPGSFFRAGLQLSLAEEDNINRSIKVKGGIYTAKAKEGRYVYKNAPFGYRKEGERKERRLVIEETADKPAEYK